MRWCYLISWQKVGASKKFSWFIVEAFKKNCQSSSPIPNNHVKTKAMNQVEGFYSLTPHDVLNGIEEFGFRPTGEYRQLNSYENRVFDVSLETSETTPDRVVTKFYRPLRWTEDAILDEHDFLIELKKEGISAIAPLVGRNQSTLLEFNGLFMAVFPKVLGRNPQEFIGDELKQVGRVLARIHNVGSQTLAEHRPTMNVETYGWENLDIIDNWVAPEVEKRYFEAAELICEYLEDHLEEETFFRIHGDCHKGNLLNNGKEFFFVDFDDFCNGPVAQDFWMLFSSQHNEEIQEEKDQILSGYEELRDFDRSQEKLFPALRGLRIIHYASWIARRWQDPSFPKIFPDFNSYRFWAEETENLEKIAWSLS